MKKKINIKQTVYSNILVIFNNIIALIVFILGINLIKKIQDENIAVFGLVVLLLLTLKLLDPRIKILYDDIENESD